MPKHPLPIAALAAVPLLAGAAGPALAQTAAPSPTQPPVRTAPRNPGGISAGATQDDQQQMDRTVDSIDRKLLAEEKTRPALPGQAPSPSQREAGGRVSTPQ